MSRLASTLFRRATLAIAMIASVALFAFLEAGFEYMRTVAGASDNTFRWMFTRFLVPWAELVAFAPAVIWLARSVPLSAPARLRGIAVHAAAALLIGTAHLTLVALDSVYLRGAPGGLWPLLAEMLSGYLLRDIALYWATIGVAQAWWHRRELADRELREATLRADLASARLAALQAQLEPHFLFNALNTAVMMVRGGLREEAVGVLIELSDLLRAVVRQAPDRLVALADELRFIERYLAIEQARFGPRLRVEITCEPGLEQVKVPFLVLQPLAENAIRHGISQNAAAGHVAVAARRDGDRLSLTVTDTGAATGAVAASGTGAGLGIVRSRLAVGYGSNATFELTSLPDGRTRAAIVMPAA